MPRVLIFFLGYNPGGSDKVIEHSDEIRNIVHTDTLLGTFNCESLDEIE